MKYPWLDAYLLSLPHTPKDYKAEWEWTRYMVEGKLYAALCDDASGKPVLTLKLDPLEGEFLRGQYPDIAPGHYMNKRHWNSISLVGDVPDDLLRELCVKSHDLIIASLPKKVRDALNA